jgi:hypothetical protein
MGDLKTLMSEMAEIDERAKVIKSEKADCQGKIDETIKEKIKQARALQGVDTGVVNILVDGVEVKHSIPKSVVWDQEKLTEVYDKIKEHGDNPLDYITRKLSVAEKSYSAFIPSIKEVFAPARTVGAGKPTVKLKIKEV